MGVFSRGKDQGRQPGMKELNEALSKLQSNAYIPINVQPVNPPILSPVSWETGRLVDLQMQLLNRYNQGDALFNMDERIYSAVDLMAVMIRKSYNGVAIKQADKGKIADLTTQEQNALDEAQNLADNVLNVPELFYSYTRDLFKYGDVVDLITVDPIKGVTGLLPLPMNYVTAIDDIRQFRQVLPLGMNVVNNPKFYIVDELNARYDVADKIYMANQILHISVDKRRNWIRDNIGRWTFNVWSNAPIQTLRVLIEWKQVLIRNDMLWRNRSVPREWHALDLSVYDPSKYSGDYKTKIANATADAQAAIAAYTAGISRREADQGFVTDKNTVIGMVEPKSANYHQPNELIHQINTLISAPTGTPDGLMGGEGKGSAALLYSSSFAAMRAEIYADKIKHAIETIIKRHVKIMHPLIPDDVIQRLHIKTRLILDRDRGELAKIIAILVGAKVFTADEIRQVWGLDPMTEDQSQQILEWIKDTNPTPLPFEGGKSPAQATDDKLGEKQGAESETPGQRMRNQNQTGQR